MDRSKRRAAALVVLALLASGTAFGGSIEGRWTLVEQSYGAGDSNLVDPQQPLRLEFLRDGERLVGRLWVGDDKAGARVWPAWFAAGREFPVELRERRAETGSARARYRVRPSPADEMRLEITETYWLDPTGRGLLGEVTAVFQTADGPRGSYVLHRRFERLP